jgi:hypothetical protein
MEAKRREAPPTPERLQYSHGSCTLFPNEWHEPVQYEDSGLMWLYLSLEPTGSMFGRDAVRALQCRVCGNVYVPTKIGSKPGYAKRRIRNG